LESAEVTEKSNEAPAIKVKVENNVGIGFPLAVVGWLAGIVLAKGSMAWLATFFAPYAWYLAVERAMQALGLTT